MRHEVIATELKPLRLNLAQYCIQCGDRWCESTACIAKHARSRWMICDRCDGTMEDDDGCPCGCLFGLVEDWPAPDYQVELAAVRAVAVG